MATGTDFGTAGLGTSATSPPAGASSPAAATSSNTQAAAAKEAKSAECVSAACGKGCQEGGIQPQCSKYQSELNASCQKIMTPFTNACSSCGGSGTSGGSGGSGGGGGSSDSGGSGTTYEASPYVFKFRYETDVIDFPRYMLIKSYVYGEGPGPAIVGYSDSNVGYPMADDSDNPRVITSAHFFSANGLVRFNNISMPSVTKVFISELDIASDDIAPVLDVLNTGDLLLFTKYNDDDTFVSLKFISQIDKGNKREITVEYLSHNGNIAEDDIFEFDTSRNIIKIPEGATAVSACPDCGGSGLEGCSGLEGVILAVYNGSAAFAGVNNIDIYGIVQPS